MNGEFMNENIDLYGTEILDYYTELVKTMYLKEDQTLGINARNKIIASYNRMMQAEKVAHINSLITRLGNDVTLTALSNLMYINTLDKSTPLLKTYATIKVYVALKTQFLSQSVDPLHVISTFDPDIWQNDNIQSYANAALEYNKYDALLSNATKRINDQTKVS